MSTRRRDWQRLKRARSREAKRVETARQEEQRRRSREARAAHQRALDEEDARQRRVAETARQKRRVVEARLRDRRRSEYGRRAAEAFAPTPVASQRERRMAERYVAWAQSRAHGREDLAEHDISLDTWLLEVRRSHSRRRRPLQALLWWFLQLPLLYLVVWGLFLAASEMVQHEGVVSVLGLLGVLVWTIPAVVLLFALPIAPFIAFAPGFYDADEGMALLKKRPLPIDRILADRAAYAQWREETRTAAAVNDKRLAELGIRA